jgi:glycosyltransferase involved in cell wall biosynthesis
MQHHRHIGILNQNPLIIYSCVDSFVPLERNIADLIATVSDRPFSLILQIWQSWEKLQIDNPKMIDEIAASIHRHCKGHPANAIWVACNTDAEVAIARARNLNARFLYQNAFIDETKFRIMPEKSKRFDAVYAAQMWDRKRHELAALVDPIVLIFALHLGPAALARLAQVKSFMPQAVLANGDPLAPGGEYRYLGASEICGVFNQSRVGLCLSAHEGASLSCVEYLLTGLPVVSTPSLGGRDVIFEAPWALICDETPEAVRDAVKTMIARNLNRYATRRAVVSRLTAYRAEWRQFIRRVCATMGNPEGNEFPESFRQIRSHWCGMPIKSVAELAGKLQEVRAPGIGGAGV